MRGDWLRLREAADLAGRRPAALLELCRSGAVLARSSRGRWAVHRLDVARLIRRRLGPPARNVRQG